MSETIEFVFDGKAYETPYGPRWGVEVIRIDALDQHYRPRALRTASSAVIALTQAIAALTSGRITRCVRCQSVIYVVKKDVTVYCDPHHACKEARA